MAEATNPPRDDVDEGKRDFIYLLGGAAGVVGVGIVADAIKVGIDGLL